MMHNSISEVRFAYLSSLGVTNDKCLQGLGTITMEHNFSLKQGEIMIQIFLKFKNIRLERLVFSRFFECNFQILGTAQFFP